MYYQSDAFLFSNEYKLIKPVKSAKFGFFLHTSRTDDLQTWKGTGSFIETGKKIELFYATTGYRNRYYCLNNKNHPDTLYIRWFDWWGEEQFWFNIIEIDSTNNGKILKNYNPFAFLKIPLSEIQSTKFSLCPFAHKTGHYDIELSTGTNEIHIFYNYPEMMHSFAQRSETMRKNAKGFVGKAMWSKQKKIQYFQNKKS